MSALSPRQMFLLDQACRPINEAFGDYGCVLVGTAMTRGPFRDVDVRFIMADKKHHKLTKAIGQSGVSFLGLAIGQYLASLTQLPIDFQIQRQTVADALHKGSRNPLGNRTLDNYKGDAQTSDMERMLTQLRAENPSDVLSTPGVRYPPVSPPDEPKIVPPPSVADPANLIDIFDGSRSGEDTTKRSK